MIPFKILDLQGASAVAAISPSHMRQLIKRGEGPALTRIGRRVGVRTDKLAEWLESRTSPVTHQAA